jgi:EAL domain-containing protein (putative c-di-GMP-specific phosphodiesterase class I)
MNESLESFLSLDRLLISIDAESIRPHFQPIVDLWERRTVGYEVLSRGPHPFEPPDALFERARCIGVTWELERACRLAALRRIAALPPALRNASTFFLNIEPDIFDDDRFVRGFTLSFLREHGISQANVVIEITERTSIADYRRFECAIRHYAMQGFQIALDDFGSGHSGLITLISCVPHYLKLDMGVVRDIDRGVYKQMILKSVVALADNIGADLIAEGVETWGELHALMRHGVRFAQGFLLGRPEPMPMPLSELVLHRLSTKQRA